MVVSGSRGGGVAAVAVFLLCSALTAVEGNYTLEILMLSYENPTHMAFSLENFRQGCCERDSARPCNPCDNAFRVCARQTPTGMTEGHCNLIDNMESTVIAPDNDDLTFTIGEDVGGLSNPIVVSGEMWTGTVEVVFSVFDLDLTTTIDLESSDVVDNIFVYPDVDAVLSTDDPFSDSVTFTGNANYSHLELAFRLTCGEDHYGPDCTFCVDNTPAHYTCDNVTGVRVCLQGYQGPECDQCVPAENCSDEGGYCTQPGECLCHSGYSGDNCSDHVCLNQTCSGHGSCKPNREMSPHYICECDEGYNGTDCEKVQCVQVCESGEECVNGTCVCVEECEVESCEVECGDNGECVKVEGESDSCECVDGYSYDGKLCVKDPVEDPRSEESSGGNGVLVIVVATVGGLLFILIVLVVIAICVLIFRGRKIKENDEGAAPNPYETPFFRKLRGNGHTSNGISEKNFENPLYHERTNSPASPPLPPRPQEHPYATLEDINSSYAQIPADLVGSPDEKSAHLAVPVPEAALGNPYDHISSPPTGDVAFSPSPRVENPYLNPVATGSRPEPPAQELATSTSDNAMNSSTILYAHIQ